ncbi:trimethylamine methyltransferase family protein [Kaustia mangrovi]|uniref:Methyltransferase n=1 Tax=Kaustia mangrovi TaxID=2593653 RepID=A0A7S8C6W6_9HYPH|nr:trimethylamine methyltransferase family protein [Kaustia mangrovi]QPC44437.1 trimethylamine methyltransferase family protein [Kaustia mangrovi]
MASELNGGGEHRTPEGRRGRGGRASRRAARQGGGTASLAQLPWGQPHLPFPPMTLLSEDQIEAIHAASLQVLEEIGVDFLLPEARTVLKEAGADVDPGSERVRFDRALVEEKIATAPERFTIHARNPERNLEMGGNRIAFSAIASPPNASDMDRGRRVGNTEDFRNLLRLAQYFNVIHMTGGYPVEPVDRHPSIRHLECLRDVVTLTDKVGHAYSLGSERIRDGMEIYRIARGVSPERFAMEPSMVSIINSSSPLRLDAPMLGGIMEMSARGQPVCLTPFTLAGAMAPVTLSGAVVEQNAEALAGLVFTQAVNPGAPFIYGAFTSNVDMKSGAPAFGTPEYMKTAIIGGQMARRYKVPYRTSNTNAANTVDAQAAYESVFSLWGAVMGGGNFVKHAAGWLEGGLVASFEKFILDVDLLQMVCEFLKPVEVDPDSLALDAMREVGPGGHFFGAMHTQERYRTAFYAPLVSDWRNHQAWEEAGSPRAWQKANAVFKQALAEYEPPPLDPAIKDELDAFVARRIEEGGAPTDF